MKKAVIGGIIIVIVFVGLGYHLGGTKDRNTFKAVIKKRNKDAKEVEASYLSKYIKTLGN